MTHDHDGVVVEWADGEWARLHRLLEMREERRRMEREVVYCYNIGMTTTALGGLFGLSKKRCLRLLKRMRERGVDVRLRYV